MDAHPLPGGRIRFGPFEVDLEALQLRKDGLKLRVSGQPLDVLAILLRYPGRVVTREELRASLWPSTVVDYEHSLNAAIKKLREALGDSPDQPRYIETIPRRGYRFIGSLEIERPREPVSPAAEPRQAPLPHGESATARAPPAAVHPDIPPAAARKPRRQAPAIGAAAVLAALALLAILALRPRAPSAPRLVQLTNFADSASSPVLSPNGQMLAFLHGKGTFVAPGEVFLKILPSGEPFQLTHDNLPKMSPVFSPDGSRIAYTVNDRWSWDTWIVPVLGGAPQRWLRNVSGLTWIGDHRLLYSEIDRGIHMNLSTADESRTERRTVYRPEDGNGMAHRSYLSPDHRWVLLVEMDHIGTWLPCRLVPFDGSSPGNPVGPSSARCTSAAWSPDGKWMYFSADAGGGFHIWRQRFPSGEAEQVTFGATQEEGIAIAPDGRSFITSIGEEQSAVWLHDSEGERPISSEGYAYVPALSPDDGKLYYLARAEASKAVVSGELWALDLRTGKRARLFPGILMTRYDLSSSGSQVVFSRDEGERRSSLWLAPLEGDLPPRRLATRDAFRPLFGPGDTTIFFLRREGEGNRIYRVAADGTGARRVMAEPVISLQSVSPDGHWVVAWVASAAQRGEGTGTVKAFPTDGGSPRPICTDCSVSSSFPIVRWSRDQRSFYFASHAVPGMRGGKTFVVPVAAGQALPDLPAEGIRSEADLLALPGVRMVEQTDIAPGSNPSIYAFSRTLTHRNLYRLQVP